MYFNPLAIIVTVVGLYLLIRLKFFYIIHPVRTIKKTFGAIKDRSAFRSLCLALAGTLGVGNILGVAVGLLLGGPGSLFWMLVSAFLALVLKYSEATLCRSHSAHRTDGAHGGMVYAIRHSLGKHGGYLSYIYAIATILLSFSMGSSLQLVSVTGISEQIFDTPPTVVIVFFVLAVAFAVLGGSKIIGRITAICIPVTTIIYITLTLSIIVLHSSMLQPVLLLVLDDAFSLDGISGGILGFLLSGGFCEGFSRGILSNEAGAGTSATAHASSSILSPSACGLMGMLEVFFDTVLLCSLTGLSILVTYPDLSSFTTGMELVYSAFFSVFGSGGAYAVLLCVIIFAYSTVVCWYYYGAEALAFICGPSSRMPFTALFLMCLPLGTLFGELILISITDILLLILTVITCFTLIKNSDRVVALSESGGIVSKSLLRGIKGSGAWTKR